MPTPQPRRVTKPLTTAEQERLRTMREQIASELPDLIAGDRLRREAQAEPTLSGELRRAIHRSALSLAKIAEESGIPPVQLDEFLTGERTLRSDVLDRLASVLGFVLQAKESSKAHQPAAQQRIAWERLSRIKSRS